MKTNLGKHADEVRSAFAEVDGARYCCRAVPLIYYAINRTSAPFLTGRGNNL